MNLQLLGPVEATLEGRPIPLGTTKQRAVLAMLALEPNATVSVDRLIDGLWGEEPPASAGKMVQLYVSQLRRVLAVGAAEIVTHGRGYELRVPEEAVDATRFERLVDLAERTNGASRATAREAIELWRGAALADVAGEPFAAAEIRRLDELRLRASELAIEADLADGRTHDALAQLERLIELHPLRERLHAQRMLALYRSGRQAEALEAYQHVRRLLVEQIGAEPGPELRRLHDAVLRQDPALDAVVPQRPAEAAEPGRGRAPRRRAPLVAAGLVLLLAIVAFTAIRLTRSEGLPRIDADYVGEIDAGNRQIKSEYRVGRGAGALAVGAGSVWVANRLDGTVSRIEPDNSRTTIPVGDEPVGLALSPGALWVTVRGERSVLQVNVEANRVVRRIEVGNAPGGIASGFGAIWVASEVDRRVVKIDAASGDVLERIDVGANPTAVAAGAGAVWVASEEAGTVFRIEPRSATVIDTIGSGNAPSAIAVGEGAVWIANRQDANVWRIDPASGSAESVRVGREPSAIAAGAGAVWVADSGGGTVTRIDPATLATEEIDVGNRPVAIGVDGESVWTAALASVESHRGGTLRVESEELETLDPAEISWHVQWLSYDGLVGYRRSGGSTFGTLVGDLASGVPEPSPDGRTYVFTLRPGIRYSNGAPVRPEDFRASLEHVVALTPRDALPFADRIVGVRACARRPASCDLSGGIEVDGRARTITIHLTEPDPDLLHKLASPLAYVVPAGHPFGGPVPPPATGPYAIDRWEPGNEARFVRNPHFRVWSADARPDGVADEIVVRQRADVHARIADVQRGAGDVVTIADEFGSSLAPERLPALAARSAGQLYTSAAPSLDYMFLNTRMPPFDDVRVRRALNYAVDRRAIAEMSGAPDLAQPACQFVPPGFPGYLPSCRYTADPGVAGGWTAPDVGRARRLIERSGTRGMKVRVWGYDDKDDVVRYFAALLRDLGYDASATVLPDYVTYKETMGGTGQIGVDAFTADFPTPSNFAQFFGCEPAYASHFCGRRITAQIDAALATRGAEADALWRRVYGSIDRAVPAVPLLNRRTLTLVSRRVGNYAEHPLWGPLLDQIWVR